MAVINCPSCKKKISDKAKQCQYCQLSLVDLDTDKLNHLSTVNRINQSQKLMNYSFIAMLLFCGGFLMMFWDSVQPDSWQHKLAMLSTVIGFIMYIIIRVKILFIKRKS